jgi:predicted solute-binding protein
MTEIKKEQYLGAHENLLNYLAGEAKKAVGGKDIPEGQVENYFKTIDNMLLDKEQKEELIEFIKNIESGKLDEPERNKQIVEEIIRQANYENNLN